MALIATTFRTVSREVDEEQSGYTEGIGRIVIREGYHEDPSPAVDDVLITSERYTYNQYDRLMRFDLEERTIETPGGPPLEIKVTTYASVWLPGVNHGRVLTKVQEDKTVYWCFTPLSDGDNLAYTRHVDAYVVYTQSVTEDPPTAEQETAIEEDGRNADGTPGVVISTGRLWSDILQDGAIVADATSRQTTRWVERVVYEDEMVVEEADKYTIWTYRKNGLNSGDVALDGPRFVRKQGFRYRLPVPVDPPRVQVTNRVFGVDVDGIAVYVREGGAKLKHALIERETFIPPEKYRVLRKTISEPSRTAAGDRTDWWESDPSAPSSANLLTVSSAADYAGGGASATPSPTSYTEPGDPAEPVSPEWEEIAEIELVDRDLAKTAQDCKGSYLDTDVEDGGVYEYAAVAIIGYDESERSEGAQGTPAGTRNRSSRMGVRVNEYANGETVTEYDASPPDDPYYPDWEYGEAIVFDVPAMVGIGEAAVYSATAGADDAGVLVGGVGSGNTGEGGVGGTGVTADELAAAYGQIELEPGQSALRPAPETLANGAELLTIESLGDAIAERVFETERPERLMVDLTVNIPLLGLRKWMDVTTPAMSFDTHGGGVTITTDVAATQWKLVGWRLSVSTDTNGVQLSKTLLRLVER